MTTPATIKSGLLWAVVTAGLLLTTGSAAAQNREGAFSVSPFAGGQGFPFGGDTHFDGDFNYGVRAGYNLTDRVTAELVFGMNNTVHDPETAFCTVYQYGADFLYHFQPNKRLVPFVAAGVGIFDVRYDGSYDKNPPPPNSLADDTYPYFNYGAGVNYSLTRWLALRVDFRHAITLTTHDNALQGVVGLRFQF